MKKFYFLLLVVCFVSSLRGQITIIGHNLLNNSAIYNTKITVKDGAVITKTLNTGTKSDFKIQLDFGKKYLIYFENARSPLMFLEVFANQVPPEKHEYLMRYEMDVPFVDKNDEDIDTSVFKNSFHKIVFDGSKRMVDDTTYNNAFSRSVLKVHKKAEEVIQPVVKKEIPQAEQPAILAGKIILNSNKKLTVSNRPISVISKSGKIIKSGSTNRFGAFSFTGIMVSEIEGIKLEAKDAEAAKNIFTLMSTKSSSIANSKTEGSSNVWNLGPDEIVKLVDNNFTTNIGGKLVSSTAKEKKFFADKHVYLSNKLNTVIKKTKTNEFGTFVFEDIKPDHNYYIGVDKAEVANGEKVDLLSKEDNYIATLDTVTAGRTSMKLSSTYNQIFNDLSVDEDEMKMEIKATIFGDNVNNPIGKLKIILLNDNYEVIDSALTDNLGTFKFKYLPFLKRFYLSAENTDNILDVFKNILIYSSEDNLIKIMTHQKGNKFSYKPVTAEIAGLRDIELDDPWLELIDHKKADPTEKREIPIVDNKLIVENVMFETGKYDINDQAKEILDKIILVMSNNKNLRIEVGAHTDSKGNNEANLKLSELRAKTVREYITKSGVDPKRIIAKGYGETKPLNHCSDAVPCSEMEHAQNRRIEFKILGQ